MSVVALPRIIQGGMGVAISNWRLARAVAERGQLGVVSGTAIETVMVRRLQDGDEGGHVRRAMEQFPMPDVADYVRTQFFQAAGRAPDQPYRLLPMYRQHVSVIRDQITMLGAFVEVTLAKEGHSGMIGINLLSKIQMPTLPTLYGAMLAGVHVVLMGAGIPREIPGALDALAHHDEASISLSVLGLPPDVREHVRFIPRTRFSGARESLARPLFFPIVSAASLAHTLARKSTGRVDGFVMESHTAGGHNAPPRGALQIDARGEPVYGERDTIDLEAMRSLGLPFWLAGGAGSPDALEHALSVGATGIQVGTLFAFSDESGFTPDIKRRVIDGALDGSLHVRTHVRASPTGYPFKVVSAATAEETPMRSRICDLGALREAVVVAGSGIVYRCPAEPVAQYVAKGGDIHDTIDRQCLCNALCASAGFAQTRGDNSQEPQLVTAGDDVMQLGRFLSGRAHYDVADVLQYLTRDGALSV